MKRKIFFTILSLAVLLALLFGCAPADDNIPDAYMAPAAESNAEIPAAEAEFSEAEPAAEAAPSTVEDTAAENSSDELVAASRRTNHLIIKNAEMDLLVEDTDTAIDRIDQIVSDLDGYIISSRVWFQDWGQMAYKYSDITIGVPVDNFESALRRLRGVALKVINENASGEDVTDEYIDLKSQVENLEATRDRIRSFLDQAETVQEALQVNEELSQIEAQIAEIQGRINYLEDQAETVQEALQVNEELSQIEAQIAEIQGRINYLEDRAAYSTISISIAPELPELPPTPTSTPYPSLTPVPTRTPEPWIPANSINSATRSLKSIYRVLAEAAIWIVVVIVPVFAPPLVVIWLLWKFVFKKKRSPKNEKSQE